MMRSHEARSFDSMQKQFFWIDHFIGDQLKDEWFNYYPTGGETAIVDGENGGAISLTTHSDGDDYNYISFYTGSDYVNTFQALKLAVFETRIKPAQLNTVIYVGFNSSTISEAIRIYTSQNENWINSTRQSSTETGTDSGVTVSTNYIILRCRAASDGGYHAHFYYDGIEGTNSPHSTNIPTTEFMRPYLGVRSPISSGGVRAMKIDYVALRQDR
jgi:hypothetical protein